mmetsp:Transcript_9942/g.25728  ORF Transcript_9942/g.25728 Transcript_9942/m.25728 type:complete len:324 (+) Transcript_9942:827-1798(+)
MHARGELLRLRDDRLCGLHPQQVAMGRKGLGALDGKLGAATDAVVALARARRLPVEEGHAHAARAAEHVACDRLHLVQGGSPLPVLAQSRVERGAARAVRVHLGREHVAHRLGERLELRRLDPPLREGAHVRGRQAHLGRARERVVQRAVAVECGAGERALDGSAEDEGLVARVDVRREQRRRLGVRPRDHQRARAHHVRLQPRSHQSVRVLARRDEHLPAHVPALLRAVCLVLKVDAGGAALDHHLHQLHGRRDPAVARVTVRHDGREEVGACVDVAVAHRRLPGAPVVVLQRAEQLVDLVGHRVLGVIRKVRPGLVGGGGG